MNQDEVANMAASAGVPSLPTLDLDRLQREIKTLTLLFDLQPGTTLELYLKDVPGNRIHVTLAWCVRELLNITNQRGERLPDCELLGALEDILTGMQPYGRDPTLGEFICFADQYLQELFRKESRGSPAVMQEPAANHNDNSAASQHDNAASQNDVIAGNGPNPNPPPAQIMFELNMGVQEGVMEVLRIFFVLQVAEVPRFWIAILCGFSNHRSAAICVAIRSLCSQGQVQPGGRGRISLTQISIDNLGDGAAILQRAGAIDTSNFSFHEVLIPLIASKDCPLIKLWPVWNILSDGMPHSELQLARAAGHNNPKSSGPQKMFKKLVKLSLAEKVRGAGVVLTDLAFPLGRP